MKAASLLGKQNSQSHTCQWEHEIDQLVYQLDGLTGDEMKIVGKIPELPLLDFRFAFQNLFSLPEPCSKKTIHTIAMGESLEVTLRSN